VLIYVCLQTAVSCTVEFRRSVVVSITWTSAWKDASRCVRQQPRRWSTSPTINIRQLCASSFCPASTRPGSPRHIVSRS